MRENNLYESSITKWRKASAGQRDTGGSARQRVVELEAQNAGLREELAASRRTADALGKAFALVEGNSKGADMRGRSGNC